MHTVTRPTPVARPGGTLPTRIQPKVVLVTGASSGVGEAIARHLAEEGHHVVLGARRTIVIAGIAQQIALAGGQALCRRLDVTDPASFESFVDFARREFGHVDVLVNAAGLPAHAQMAGLQALTPRPAIDTHTRGVLNGIAAVLPVMRAQGGGEVVNLVSHTAAILAPTQAMALTRAIDAAEALSIITIDALKDGAVGECIAVETAGAPCFTCLRDAAAPETCAVAAAVSRAIR